MNFRLPIFEYLELKREYEDILENPIIDFILSFQDKIINLQTIYSIIEKSFPNNKLNYLQKKNNKYKLFGIKQKLEKIIYFSKQFYQYFLDKNIYRDIELIFNLLFSILNFPCESFLECSLSHQLYLVDLRVKYLALKIDKNHYNNLCKYKWFNPTDRLYKDFYECAKKNNSLYMKTKN